MENQTNKKEYVDLHLHSTKSDGKLSPTEIVEESIRLGLKAIALTDHDTTASLKEALDAAKERIEVIPGVEISCYERKMGFPEVHVLGYYFNPDAAPIKALLKKSSDERLKQKKKLVENLQKMGFNITFDEVLALAQGQTSRLHVGQILLRNHPEKFSDIEEVFQNYISDTGPAYETREYQTSTKEAVEAINASGGIAVLAHPGMYNDKYALIIINHFIECGGKGIEVFYPYQKIMGHKGVDSAEEKRKIEFFRKVAKEKNLLITGGSDFHASSRKTVINDMKVPYSVVEELKKFVKKH